MPFSDDMSVLQASASHQGRARRHAELPLVLPHGDLRQLRHDGQRQAAAVCDTFLRDLLPGPVRIEALAHLPIERDLIVSAGDFVSKLESIKPYLIPREPTSARGRANTCRRPRQLDALRAVQRLHQLHAVLRGVPGIRAESRFHRPRRHGAAASLQRRFARRRPAERIEPIHGEEGVWTCMAVGIARRFARSGWTRPMP